MPIHLAPCPYCEGPPAPSVMHVDGKGEIRNAQIEAAEDGIYASAYVLCHECGARGPNVRDVVYSRAECDALELQAVELWQQRDARHRKLYDGGEPEGMNEYPRRDDVALAAAKSAAASPF